MSTHIVKIKCPYCGNETDERINFESDKVKQFIECPSEIGGCDKVMAIFLKKFISYKAYKLEGVE